MKVTFITGHLCNERQSLLNELAYDLGENGAEVTILTGYPSRGISEERRLEYLKHDFERLSDNVIVKRVGSKKGEGEGLFQRMLRYLLLCRVLYKEAKKIETDVYYFYSSPPFLGWIGAKLTKIAPTLYNAQDLFPDSLIKIKGYSEKNPLIKYLRKREREVYANMTRIVTISNDMKRNIGNYLPDVSKVSIVYNWADLISTHHVERSENKLMDELGIQKDKFIVSYAGDIGLFQGWPTIIESIKAVGRITNDILFVIIGEGSYKEKLLAEVNRNNMTNVQVLPIQSASRLSEIYSIGDLELVSIEPGITKFALPSKTSTIMAAGSAILSLTDQDSDIAVAIRQFDLGYTLEHNNPQKLTETILEAYKERDLLKQKGNNARRYAETNFNRPKQTKAYYDIMVEMTVKNEY